jgi:hypothetical protein
VPRGLDRNPAAVLFQRHRFVDESGNELDRASLDDLIGDYNRLHTISMNLVERVKELSKTINWFRFTV